MPADSQVLEPILKTFYGANIVTQIAKRTRILDRVRTEDSRDWGGSIVSYPVKVGRNTGFVAMIEGGAFPTPLNQQYGRFLIPMRDIAGGVQFSARIIEQSKGNKAAFITAMRSEMEGLVDDITNDRNRYLWGFGKGTLCLINGAANSVTQTLDSPLGVQGAANGNRFLNQTDILAVVNPTAPATTVRGSQSVSSISTDGTQVTFGAAINTTDNDIVVRAGATGLAATNVNGTSVDKEPVGMLALIDDGTYAPTIGGMSRTTYPIMRSTVLGSVGALSADIIQRGLDVADQLGDAEIDELWGHPSVRRAVATISENDRRYQGRDLTNPDAGTQAAKMKEITFGSLPVKTDRMAPYGILFAPCWKHICRFVLQEGQWDDRTGSILKQAINSSGQYLDSLVAYWTLRENFHNDRPNACVRWDGVSATVVNVHSY